MIGPGSLARSGTTVAPPPRRRRTSGRSASSWRAQRVRGSRHLGRDGLHRLKAVAKAGEEVVGGVVGRCRGLSMSAGVDSG